MSILKSNQTAQLQKLFQMPDLSKIATSKTEQEHALQKYFSSYSYKINYMLRNGCELDSEALSFIKNFDEKLKTVNKYNGTTFRALMFNNEEDFIDYAMQRRDGTIFSNSAYLSTSKNVNDYLNDDSPYKAIFKINGVSGRDISKAGLKGENEITFERGQKFKIHDTGIYHGNLFFGEADEIQ